MSVSRMRTITPPATMVIEQPEFPLRLSMKPAAPSMGYVDGAWWPRSRDLATELPTLLAALAVRMGDIASVSYSLASWEAAPRRITVAGNSVRLAGFHYQHAQALDVIGADRRRITLLVVPPEASPSSARDTMAAAALPGNAEGLDELLAPELGAPR